MQIALAARYASPYILSVVLEVYAENGLCFAERSDSAVNRFSLLGIWKQLRYRRVSYGHIVEKPAEESPGIDYIVKEFFTRYIFVVFGSIASFSAIPYSNNSVPIAFP